MEQKGLKVNMGKIKVKTSTVRQWQEESGGISKKDVGINTVVNMLHNMLSDILSTILKIATASL
jgi:hypothetical protein